MVLKRAVLLCAATVLLVMSVASFAQGAKGQKGAKRQGRGASFASMPVDELDKLLGLTADQKTKITAIHDKYVSEAKPLRGGSGGKVDPANKQKLAALGMQAQKDVEAILTPEQKTKMQTIAKEFGGLRASGLPIALLAELNLTPDQRSKIGAVVEDMRAKNKGAEPGKRKEMLQEAKTKMLEILTPEQRTTAEKFLKEHGKGGKKGKKPKGLAI